MNRADLRRLALLRLQEAKALQNASFSCGAYYLAGFTVECALKARIAAKTQAEEFPDKKRAVEAFEHSPEKLIRTAELQNELAQEIKSDQKFEENWEIVRGWSVERRYDGMVAPETAQTLLDAIDDPDHGVLKWLQQYW